MDIGQLVAQTQESLVVPLDHEYLLALYTPVDDVVAGACILDPQSSCHSAMDYNSSL